MRVLVICLFAIAMSFCNCNAQRKSNSSKKTVTTSSLKFNKVKHGYFLKDFAGTEWQYRANNRSDRYISETYLFTQNSIIYRREVKGHPDYNKTYRHLFYLSDSVPNSFDDSKVGKSMSGRYIIEKEKSGQVVAMKIQKFTDDSLVLFIKDDSKPDGQIIIGGGDITLYYCRINKPEPYNGEPMKKHTDNEDVSVMKEPDMREP